MDPKVSKYTVEKSPKNVSFENNIASEASSST